MASILVLHDPINLSLLAAIHRAEARSIASELRSLRYDVSLQAFRTERVAALTACTLLLRLSDPQMRSAARTLTLASLSYIGPRVKTIERSYDKYEAAHIVGAAGFDVPETMLGNAAEHISLPLIVKPRCGSDSIGVRIVNTGRIPPSKQNK